MERTRGDEARIAAKPAARWAPPAILFLALSLGFTGSCREGSSPRPAPAASASASAASISPSASAAAPPVASSAQPSPPAALPRIADGMRWSPSGRKLATWRTCECPRRAYGEGSATPCPVVTWDLRRGVVEATFEAICAADLFDVAWSADESLFAISSYSLLRVWRRAGDEPIFETGNIAVHGGFQWSPDGARILWQAESGGSVLFESATGKVVRRASVFPEGATVEGATAWDPKGLLLAVSVQDGPLQIWDGRTGAFLREIKVPGMKPLDAPRVQWLPDGSGLVFANERGLLGLADARTGATKVLRRPSGEKPSRRTWMTLREDGRELAVENGDGRLELWNLATGSPRELLGPGRPDPLIPATFSPDGKHLALVRQGALDLVPIDAPDKMRHIDFGDAGQLGTTMIGWGRDGLYHAVLGATLVALSPEGEPLRHELGELDTHVLLSPDRRFAAIAGRGLQVLRLRDRRAIQLVPSEASGRVTGTVKGASSEAELAAFFEGP